MTRSREDHQIVAVPVRSVPDLMITWTTSLALIAFGIIFFDDAVIMGRTILGLGVMSASNEVLKFRAQRASFPGRYHQLRLLIAAVYVGLMLIGFLLPGSDR